MCIASYPGIKLLEIFLREITLHIKMFILVLPLNKQKKNKNEQTNPKIGYNLTRGETVIYQII